MGEGQGKACSKGGKALGEEDAVGRPLLQVARWDVRREKVAVEQVAPVDQAKVADGVWQKVGGQTSVPSGGSLEAPDQEADQGDEPAEAERVREREAVGEATEGRGARRKEVPSIAKVTKKK